MGKDKSEIDTIGVQTITGFPIPYRTTAPGLAWAQFNIIGWGLNTGAWLLIMSSAIFGVHILKRKTESSNKKVEHISDSANAV